MNELPIKEIICGDWIEVAKSLPSGFAHCIVTSPPYWGQRDYGCPGQLGLEKTPEEHIEKLVEGFREYRRVLRDDGVMFLNYGDKYNTEGGNYRGIKQGIKGEAGSTLSGGMKQLANKAYRYDGRRIETGKKQGDLLMLPARVALALQEDGWILRDDIIWAKAISFCDKYSGSCMPESVNGWRWERHKIKVKSKKGKVQSKDHNGIMGGPMRDHSGKEFLDKTEWQDCPGCEKCEGNGGLILRRGSWRCTKAHEHIFQFVKSNNYFCDMEAVKEKSIKGAAGSRFDKGKTAIHEENRSQEGYRDSGVNRNLRNVWAINPRGYKDAHYATYPEAVVEPCIKVATSQKGVCPKCGSQWARIVDNKQIRRERPNDRTDRHNQGGGVNSCGNTVAGVETTTLGWKATCDCGIEETVPAVVLDPFMGSGTTAVVAAKLNRNYFGCELNPEYIDNHIADRVKEAETGVSVKEARAGQKALFE